jgi:hypothetical protein
MSLYNYLDGSLKNLFTIGATDKTKIQTSATQSTITPSSNSSTALVFTKLDGTTPVGKFDIANAAFSLPNTSILSIGKSDTTDVYLKADVSGQIGTPAIRYYNSTGKWQYSNDGTTYTNFSLANAVPPGQASQLLQTNIDASDTSWVTPEYIGGDDMWSSSIPIHPNMTGRKEAVIASAGTKICMGLVLTLPEIIKMIGMCMM